MHVTFDRCDHERSGRSAFVLVLFHKWQQIRHCLFHDPRTFYHLRQEHFAGAKEFTDDFHAVHQWTFDHFERTIKALSCLFRIRFDMAGDALDQRVRDAFRYGTAAPVIGCGFIRFFFGFRDCPSASCEELLEDFWITFFGCPFVKRSQSVHALEHGVMDTLFW